MADKKIGKARPGASVTRKVTVGDNKGDTVQFKANAAGTQHPGKLVPRRVTKDVGKKNNADSLPKGKKPKTNKLNIPQARKVRNRRLSDFMTEK